MIQISPNGKRMRSQIVGRALQDDPKWDPSLPGQDWAHVIVSAVPRRRRREKLKWWLNRLMWIATLCTITGQ